MAWILFKISDALAEVAIKIATMRQMERRVVDANRRLAKKKSEYERKYGHAPPSR